MAAQIEPNSAQRFPALDSLRGIAAVSVVTYHLLNGMAILPWRLFFRTPLVALLMGPEAVLLFFVLSGFVLTLQLSKNVSYFQYVAHRICRIYIPYIMAIFIAAICMAAIPHGAIPWLTNVALINLWRKPADFAMIAPAIAFIYPTMKLMKFDPVVWSLVYEMRISLIFPLLLLAIRRLGTMPVLLGGAAVSALICINVMPTDGDYVKKAINTSDWLPTLHYMFLFICGAAIALTSCGSR